MEADEAVRQAAQELLIVVPRAQKEVPVDGEDPERVQESHLLRDSLVGSGKLIEDGPVQAVVDGVQRQTLRSSLRL